MKRIVILGAGESGAGAAVLAQAKGFDTFVSDMSTINNSVNIIEKHLLEITENNVFYQQTF